MHWCACARTRSLVGQSILFETKVRAPRVLGVHVAVAHDRHDDTEPMANGARASYVDVQFLEQTVDVLFKCRHTFMFTKLSDGD